jgi:hypothetical protein
MLTGWGAQEVAVAMTMYTDAYVIRGTLMTRQRRISDALNQADEEFLVLADVELEAIGPRTERHSAPYAQVNLGSVLFAIATDSVTPVPELRTPKSIEHTLVSIPPFSVTGQLHLMAGHEVRDALHELGGRFIPVTDATFWSDSLGVARATAPMVAVNRSRAQILSPYVEPPAAE